MKADAIEKDNKLIFQRKQQSEMIYDKRLNWTTDRPTKPGCYWAYIKSLGAPSYGK